MFSTSITITNFTCCIFVVKILYIFFLYYNVGKSFYPFFSIILFEVFFVSNKFIVYYKRRRLEISLRCDICNIDVHRASYAKHLGSKKHLENKRQNYIIIPEWLFKEEPTPTKKQIKTLHKPKTLKEIAKESFKLNDRELDKEIAKK